MENQAVNRGGMVFRKRETRIKKPSRQGVGIYPFYCQNLYKYAEQLNQKPAMFPPYTDSTYENMRNF